MKSIILLSGGLDSLVSLGLGIKKYNIKLAITFDYGQNLRRRKFRPQKIFVSIIKLSTK